MPDFDYDALRKIRGKYKIRSRDPQKLSTIYRLARYLVFGALAIRAIASFWKNTDSGTEIGLVFFALLIIASVLLSLSFSFIQLYELWKDNPFTSELNQVYAEYKESKDAEHYLRQLLSLRAVAENAAIIAQWRLCLADALAAQHRYEEALYVMEDLDSLVSGKAKEQLVNTRARIHALSTTASHRQEMDPPA